MIINEIETGPVMLVSLERAKTVLGLTGSGGDALLEDQIISASERIEAYLRRSIRLAEVTEVFPLSHGAACLQVSRYPLQNVIGFESDGITLDLGGLTMQSDAGLVYVNSGFYRGVTKLTYVGGYVTIPRPIQDAVLTLVKQKRENALAPVGIKSERLEGVSSTTYFDPGETGFPQEIETDLEPFRAYFV